jgi:putative oxidoreductase
MDTNDLSLLIIQVGVGLTFAAHGAQKLFGWWGGPGREGWLQAVEHMGFRPATLFAPAAAFAEIGGGLLLAAGFVTPLAAAALVAMSIAIIGMVHWPNGFFNARGGIEFPLLLGLGAAAVGIAGAGAFSVDRLAGIAFDPTVRVALVLAGVAAGAVAVAVPRLRTESAASAA